MAPGVSTANNGEGESGLHTFGGIQLKWDAKDLEIKTRSVELALQPLVMKVTTLVNTDSSRKKGRSKRAHVLVALVEKATENFIKNGEIIAEENPDIKSEMMEVVDQVRKTGQIMTDTSREFADDPCSSQKRGNMVRAARALLLAVTRLLILADMVDVHLLLKSLRIVEDDLERLKKASNQNELMDGLRTFGRNASGLLKEAARRQQELRDPQLRDDLAAARALLKKHSTMLMTASKVYLRHPELAAAKANRDFVLRQVCEAVNAISDIAKGHGHASTQTQQSYGPGELAAALNDLDRNIYMNPLEYNERRTRQTLEEQLESIISGAALMADSSSTRDDRRERIIAECNAVRQALQDLLTEYMANTGKKDRSDNLERAAEHMNKKTKDLRRQLRKAVVDHVCDSFLDTNTPLHILIEAAKSGNEKEVEQYAQVFSEHARKLVEVANLCCSMSDKEDGVKMVRHAASLIESLCPQVINAAKILAARPKSKPALDNMETFRRTWENQTRILTEAVDDIVIIDDLLAVTENHILEDVNKCIAAVQEQDSETLDRTAGSIQGRVSRVTDVVTSEMNEYEPGAYTSIVIDAVKDLREQVMPNFVAKVDTAVEALSSNPPKDVDENEFIDASSRVYDGIREIRRAVLFNRDEDEWDPDDVIGDEQTETGSKISGVTGSHTDERAQRRQALEKLPEEEKKKIAQQVESFRTEKQKFDREVTKWDDSGNDIIVLAKHMCVIMMEMTDFTWGRGPLKTTMDVINAAKKISELGTKLDKYAREIAESCPEGSIKKDLLAYLGQIALYCHQLNITSKVKADVQNISGDLVLSGLDSATSLIQAAKNLMTAVVSTVKTSYIASAKFPKSGAPTGGRATKFVWKMKPPEKKPLVRKERPEEIRAIVRRGSQKRQNPILALSEFQRPMEEI